MFDSEKSFPPAAAQAVGFGLFIDLAVLAAIESAVKNETGITSPFYGIVESSYRVACEYGYRGSLLNFLARFLENLEEVVMRGGEKRFQFAVDDIKRN